VRVRSQSAGLFPRETSSRRARQSDALELLPPLRELEGGVEVA
jgi:hypothetical protein